MIKHIESIEKQSNTDLYKSLLKSYILGDYSQLKLMSEEIERYIAVFSLYLRHSNDAYKYNLTYLSYQHTEYLKFLNAASRKTKKLQSIAFKIKNSEPIKKLIDENHNKINENNILISLNNFLVTTLAGDIDFHKAFSISGANRKNENDIITIEYNQQIRTVKLSTSNKSDVEKVITTVERILINSLKNGEDK